MIIAKIAVTVYPQFPEGFNGNVIEFVLNRAATRINIQSYKQQHDWEMNKYELLWNSIQNELDPSMKVVGEGAYGNLWYVIEVDDHTKIQPMLKLAQAGFIKGLHKSGILKLKEWKEPRYNK